MPFDMEKQKQNINSEEINNLLNYPVEVKSIADLKKSLLILRKLDENPKNVDKKTIIAKKREIEKSMIDFMKNYVSKWEDISKAEIAKMFDWYINEIQKIDWEMSKELLNEVNQIRQSIISFDYKNFLPEKLFVDNDHYISIPKTMTKKFNIKVKKWSFDELKVVFSWKTDDLPLNISYDISKNDEKDVWNYSLWFWDVKAKKWVNIYKNNNHDLVMYSFEKNWKNYIGIVKAYLDQNRWNIKDFNVVTKPVEKKYTEKELKDYFDKVYDSWMFDKTWYTVERHTVVRVWDVNIALDEKAYDELKKQYSNEENLKSAVKLLEAKIAQNESIIQHFDIWLLDKSWFWTWNIMWVVVTLDWLSKAWLLKWKGSLDSYYDTISKLYISPAEIDNMVKNMNMYDIEKDKLAWLCDFNNSWLVWDNKEVSFWEKQVYEKLVKLPKKVKDKKIKEIKEFVGFSEWDENNVFDKVYFKRWIDFLVNAYWPLVLSRYLSTDESLKDSIYHNYEIGKKRLEKTLDNLMTKEQVKEFNKQVNLKTSEIMKEISRLLKKDVSNSEMADEFKNAISYAWLNALYIIETNRKDTVWGSLNFVINDDIISNVIKSISVWIVNTNKWVYAGINLWKTFKLYESQDKKTKVSAWYNLVNFVIPIANIWVEHDFSNTDIDKFNDSTKTILIHAWLLFPWIAGSIWYKFNKAEKIDQKVNKFNDFTEKIKSKIMDCKSIDCDVFDLNNYDSNVEKIAIKWLKNFLEKIDFYKIKKSAQKKEILDNAISSIVRNYKTLQYLSSKWTDLSEIWLIWAVIFPIPYIKTTTINVRYKYSWKNKIYLGDYMVDINNDNINKSKIINSVKDLKEYIWIPIELNKWKLVIDTKDLSKGTYISFGKDIQAVFKNWKIIIWWDISALKKYKFDAPGKKLNFIWFWKDSIWLWIDWNVKISWKYFYKWDKKTTYNLDSKVNKEIVWLWNSMNINDQYKKELETFEWEKLARLIDKSFDWSIFVSDAVNIPSVDKSAKNINWEWTKFINNFKSWNILDTLSYLRNTMLKRLPWDNYTPLAYFMKKINKISQKDLDSIRKWLDEVINNKDEIKWRIILEKFINNFFIDKYIKNKKDYEKIQSEVNNVLSKHWIKETYWQYILPDGKTVLKWQELYLSSVVNSLWDKKWAEIIKKWYTIRMSMKDFDTKNLFDKAIYNREAWFERTLRNEIFFSNLLNSWKKVVLWDALNNSDWFKNLDSWTQDNIRQYLSIKWESGIHKEHILSEQILSWRTNWLRNLPDNIQNKFKLFASIIVASHNYINKEQLNNPTYKTVDVKNIIAFPYTYKLWSKHTSIPIYWVTKAVDTDWNWIFDKNDYEVIDNKEVRNYMFDMFPSKFKNNFKKLIKDWFGKNLSDEELKTLFIEKELDWINIDYDVILFKWWTCFNTAIWIKWLKINWLELSLNVVDSTISLMNDSDIDVTNNMFGVWYHKHKPKWWEKKNENEWENKPKPEKKEWDDNSVKPDNDDEPEDTEDTPEDTEDTPEDSNSGSTSSWWTKSWWDDWWVTWW